MPKQPHAIVTPDEWLTNLTLPLIKLDGRLYLALMENEDGCLLTKEQAESTIAQLREFYNNCPPGVVEEYNRQQKKKLAEFDETIIIRDGRKQPGDQS